MKSKWKSSRSSRSKRNLCARVAKCGRKQQTGICIAFFAMVIIFAKVVEGYLKIKIHDTELVNAAKQELLDAQRERENEKFDKVQALRQKGEILSKNLDDLTFTDIKKIYEIEYEIKRHESNPEADLHKHFEIDISDEEISLWPGCISSILAVIKNKEFMFPCLDMTKKEDLKFVLDFLHKEHNLCPNADQIEKEDLTREDEDFEDERLLSHLVPFSNIINKVEKSLSKENVLPKLLKLKSPEWDSIAASYKPKWNGKTPETLKILAHVGAAASLPPSMRSLIKDEHKFDLLSIWADTLAAINIVEYDLTLSLSLNDLEDALAEFVENIDKCEEMKDLPDVIVTDYAGLAELAKLEGSVRGPSAKGRFFEKIKCRLRVIDPFGTDPFFNDAALTEAHNANENVGFGLPSLKQFLTAYPNKENYWGGFVVSAESISEKSDRVKSAYLYGASSGIVESHPALIDMLSEDFHVFMTADPDEVDASKITPNVTNLGILLNSELQQFYQSVDVVVNVGQKVETLAPIQLIANGAFYIGPRFDHPVGRAPGAANLATNPFGSLPSFRTLDCHIPFIDEKIRTNRQRLQDFSTMKDLARIVKREASKMKPQPFIPVGFSGKEFINRLRHSIEVMDFCPKRLVHNWVDYSEMIVIQAPPGTDCSQACRTKGLTCNAEMLSFINQKRFLTNFWQKCKNIIKITSRSYWSLGYPAINGQNCILQDNAKLLGCSVPGEGENRRVCPCQKQDLYEKMSD